MKENDFKKEIEAMKYFANKNAVSVFDIVHKECRVKEEDLKREGIMVDMLNQEIKELQKEKQIEEMAKETIYQNATSIVDDIDRKNNTHHYMLYDEDINYIAKRVKEKLTEDSIILSREEYQKDFSNQFNKGYKMGCKESAEKIMQDLKPLLEGFVHTDTNENLYVYKCKQFGVEIKE